jgi:hypothetical protein
LLSYSSCQKARELWFARPPELNRGMCQKASVQKFACVCRSFASHCPCGELALHPPASPQLEFRAMMCQVPRSKL